MPISRSFLMPLGLAVLASPGFAQIAGVATRSALFPSDTINWSALGGDFTFLPDEFTISTTGGSTVLVFNALAGDNIIVENGESAFGNFNPGEILLYTEAAPITINPDDLISGAGFNIQAGVYGAFTAQVSAYGEGDAFLGSVSIAGLSTETPDGSAVFLGFSSVSTNVDYFKIELTSAVDSLTQIAINSVSFGGPGGGFTPVPEPSTYGAFAVLGLAGLVMHRRFTKRRRSAA